MVRVFGVIGHPIDHSLSPLMHEAAYQALGLEAIYAPFDAPPAQVARVLDGLDAAGIDGLNVTVPHKARVARWLGAGRLVGDAARLGAVNTLVRTRRGLIGHNTDVPGLRRLLRDDLRRPLRGTTALLLGAGGAARAAAWALAQERIGRLVIANRTPAHARALARWVRKETSIAVEVVPLSAAPRKHDERFRRAAAEARLVVNATSLGLRDADPLPIDPAELSREAALVDLVYRAPTTRLVALARRRGLLAVDGLPMLVYQGAEAFRLWWKRPAPVDAMRRAVERAVRTAHHTNATRIR
jgi:shikimate dehydrogenase